MGFAKLYTRYKEIAHVAICAGLLVFAFGVNWQKWQAQAEDLNDLRMRTFKLEITNAQILQSLTDIKDFLHVPAR